ncbi:MAG: NAD-dependent epimerase/dehydratase family protein [Actinomycetota bacterium]
MSETASPRTPPGPPLALVTGAAGFVGSHLCERLVSDGWRVRALDGLTDYYDGAQKRSNLAALEPLPGCDVVLADLRTCDLASVLDGVGVVFHQAGQPGVRASWDRFASYVEHNVNVTQRLLQACVGTGIDRFVYASSSSVYGEAAIYPTTEDDLPRPRSPYGVTKLAAEHLCGVYAANHGVPTVSLRYFTVFGPRQRPDMAMHRMIEASLAAEPFPLYGDGSAVRDFTFVSDVVEANVRAATRDVVPGTVLNVSGGTDASMRDVISAVASLTGREVLLDVRDAARGDVRRTGGSRERAERLLGWEPAVGLEAGLARQVAWHRSRQVTPA